MTMTMTSGEAAVQIARERTELRHDANLRRAEHAARKRGESRYYRRRRTLLTADGIEVDALTTRYGFGLSRRHPHGAYYADGTWYRIAETDERAHVYAPIDDEWLSDLHSEQTTEQGRVPVVRIHVVAGVAVDVITADGGCPFGGSSIAGADTPVDELESLLDLGRKAIA